MILEKRIPLQYWLSKIAGDILIVSVLAVILYLFEEKFIQFKIPISIGAFMGTAISLLLSFKLGQSYDRWWEARKVWGAIVNDSRTLVVQLLSFSQSKNNSLVEKMAYRQIAWCYSLSQNLRKQDPIQNINALISDDEINALKEQKNVPLALLANHSEDLSILHKEQTINDFQQIQIDQTLLRLCASMGKTERIKNTNFPKTYRRTLHIFVYVFLVTLSLALTELQGWVEIPLLILISIPFFFLERIAFNIQDPFENRPTDTAMTSISRTIEINIKQLLGKKEIPEPLGSDDFYIL